jgi:hypothetical protein
MGNSSAKKQLIADGKFELHQLQWGRRCLVNCAFIFLQTLIHAFEYVPGVLSAFGTQLRNAQDPQTFLITVLRNRLLFR